MSTLRELMTPDPRTLLPEMTLREAVEELSHLGVSGAPVVSGSRLVGVLSAADILEFEASNPGVPTHRSTEADWGAAELSEDVTDPPSAFFRDRWADSSGDVVERFEEEGPEWDFLAEHVVGEVMTRRIVALPPDAKLVDAARLMVGRKIHRLLVVEREELVGIVSAMDFVRAIAEERMAPTD